MERLTGTISLRTALLVAGVSFGGTTVCDLLDLSVVVAAEDSAKEAATVEEATKVLDLRTLPLPDGAVPMMERQLGSVSYETKADLKKAFQFQQQQLTKLGWKELPGAMTQPTYVTSNFQKSGFIVSVMSYANADPSKQGTAQVFLNNFGNVRLSKLPAVKGAKPLSVNDAGTSYTSALKPAEVAEATRKLLVEAGWEPYGATSNPPDSEVLTFKRNAIRLIAFVGVAPAQGNQVMISYSTSLMAADIPAPPDAKDVNFGDTTKTLEIATAADFDAVAKFYQQRLAKQGWKSTTEALTRGKDQFDRPTASLVFRNAAKDLLTLDVQAQEGKTHAKLVHFTAAELSASEQRQKVAAEKLVAENKAREDAAKKSATTKKPAKSDDGLPDVDSLIKGAVGDALKDAGLGAKKSAKGSNDKNAVSVPIPEGAKKVTRTGDNVLQIKLPAGKGQAAAKFVRDQLLAADWETDDGDDIDDTSGNVTLKKGGKQLTLTFVDTGLADVNMMVIGIGVKLEEGTADPNAKAAAKPEAKPSKSTAKKKPKSDDGDGAPTAAPPRPEKATKGIAKLSKLPNEAKVIVNGEPVALPHVLAYETVSGGRWVTRIVATEKPIRQASWIERLNKPGEVSDNDLDTPNLRLELDDQDKPNRMNCVAKNTPGGTTSNIQGEAIVEEGRARGAFKMTKPETFFDRMVLGEITFDVPVLTRDSKPAKLLADAKKLDNSGKLLVNDKPIKLGSVIAYEVKVFDEKRTAILFSVKPIDMAKLKASLAKDGNDDGLFEFQSQVKVVIDKEDKFTMMNLYHDGASLNSNADLVGEAVVEDGRARGTVKLGKPSEFFGKTFSFDLTFDVDVLKLSATDKE